MSMLKIMESIGEDHLFVQPLRDCMTGVRLTKQKPNTPQVAEVSFVTDQITPTEVMQQNSKMVGVVVWIPRDRLEAAIKAKVVK